MDLEEPIAALLVPLGLSLYDLEMSAGTLSVVVQREGGVTLDDVTEANRAISRWLDENDPIPGRYTLDVSSPGLERRLRTPAQFASARGEVVTLREHRDGAPTRRLEGVLVEANEDWLTLDDREHGRVKVPFASIERARTVFAWGNSPESTSTRRRPASPSKKG